MTSPSSSANNNNEGLTPTTDTTTKTNATTNNVPPTTLRLLEPTDATYYEETYGDAYVGAPMKYIYIPPVINRCDPGEDRVN